MTLEQLLLLPWTWDGPTVVHDPEGIYWEVRIQELPEFFVAAPTENELREELVPALAAFLRSYIDRGQEPPRPNPGRREWVFMINGRPVGVEARGRWERLGQPAEPATA